MPTYMGYVTTDFTAKRSEAVDDIVEVFTVSFSDSEGDEEGRSIGALVRELLTTTKSDDIYVFCGTENSVIIGSIIFTRIIFGDDNRTVFMLSPVAVQTARQGEGVGASLIRYGIDALRKRGVDVAITYGDPKYYARVGFEQIAQEVAQPPQKLSQPEGWLAQSLKEGVLTPLKGSPRCVDAFNNPAYW